MLYTCKLGDSCNFQAMSELCHKTHVKAPQNLINRADKSGPGLLKVAQRKEAVKSLLQGYEGEMIMYNTCIIHVHNMYKCCIRHV